MMITGFKQAEWGEYRNDDLDVLINKFYLKVPYSSDFMLEWYLKDNVLMTDNEKLQASEVTHDLKKRLLNQESAIGWDGKRADSYFLTSNGRTEKFRHILKYYLDHQEKKQVGELRNFGLSNEEMKKCLAFFKSRGYINLTKPISDGTGTDSCRIIVTSEGEGFVYNLEGTNIGSTTPSDHPVRESFSSGEKELIGNKIDELIRDIRSMDNKFNAAHEIFFDELQDLKERLNLDKKTWSQLMVGKVTEGMVTGTVDRLFGQKIYESLSAFAAPFIKLLDNGPAQ